MIVIRSATLADVAGITRVHIESWRSAYRGIVPQNILDGLSYAQRKHRWEEVLRRTARQECVYVAENEAGEIVGFASGGRSLVRDEPLYRGELFTIYILETYWRQGIGHRLFSQVVERFRALGLNSMLLWVLADNPARRFYESLGGHLLRSGDYEIGGVKLQQVAYGWLDLTQMGKALE